MASINIGEKLFNIKYTIESWKRLKEFHDITPTNLEIKLNEDVAGVISALIYYGLSPKDRQEVSQDVIDLNIDFSAVNIITNTVRESLPNKIVNDGGVDNLGEESPEKK